MKRKLLFVCTANQERSPTAEALYNDHPAFEARSCGTHVMAAVPASKELIEWADLILCMEKHHAETILTTFPSAKNKNLYILGITDVYPRYDERLILLIRERMKQVLGEGPDAVQE